MDSYKSTMKYSDEYRKIICVCVFPYELQTKMNTYLPCYPGKNVYFFRYSEVRRGCLYSLTCVKEMTK